MDIFDRLWPAFPVLSSPSAINSFRLRATVVGCESPCTTCWCHPLLCRRTLLGMMSWRRGSIGSDALPVKKGWGLHCHLLDYLLMQHFFFMSVASKITITIITTVVVIVNRPFVPSVSTEPRLGPLRLRWWFPHRTPNQREWHKMKANTIRSNKSFISLFPTYIPPKKKPTFLRSQRFWGKLPCSVWVPVGGTMYIYIYTYIQICVY